MEEHRSEDREEHSSAAKSHSWLPVVAVVLLVAVGLSLAYTFAQRSALTDLQAKNQNLASTNEQLSGTVSQMNSTVSQLRGQVDSLSSKLAAMKPPRPAARLNARGVPVRRVPTAWQRMQARLRAQQSQINAMKAEVAKQRSDMEGELGATRDQLNGSIARNHTELVALEKRGAANYSEFDLMKSKQFQRFGPVLLSLRGTNVKHQHFNMNMLINDRQLTKKNVNLYEPIWIYRRDSPQPTQVVINEIGKNYVHGYVMAPKYTRAELATMEAQQPAAGANGQVPATGNGQNPAGAATPPQQPKPPQNQVPLQPHQP